MDRILYLDRANSVSMTYYRNDVLHIFALPALLATLFLSQCHKRLSKLSEAVAKRVSSAESRLSIRQVALHWEALSTAVITYG